jgi:sn-glycerol 3-phosphate transport system permease protein
MVGPAMVFLILFTLYPMINLAYLSLFNFKLARPDLKVFTGLKNYYFLLFVKTDFRIALRNTAVYTAAVVFFLILFAVLFALWFQKDSKLNHFAQRAIFTPHLVAMISCGMIWSWIMDEKGLFNAVFEFLNLPGLHWLNSSDTAMLSIVIVSVWKSVGYYALIVLSALKAIPTDIYEAAELDNTGWFRKFFRITLPMLSPQLFFLLITITIGSFKVFDTVRTMTAGGPGNSTNVISYYIYHYVFNNNQMGLATSAGFQICW